MFNPISWLAEATGVSQWVYAGGVALALLSSGTWYHLDAVHDAEVAGRTEAVVECNTTQLEEDLATATLRAERAEKRSRDLATELEARQMELLERQQFIADLESQLEDFEDGRISDRTRQFMYILEQRSRQYNDPE